MEKNEIRKMMLLKRHNIKNKNIKSLHIIKNIEMLDEYKKAKVVAMYKCLEDEVNLDELINIAQNSGKIVLLPRVVGNNLIFIKIDENTCYEKNNFNILEPIINNNIYYGTIDVVLVPGVAFDKQNNRLGYGKGYYDRFLKDCNIFKIGVCFYQQLVSILPISLSDVSVNLIITEKRVS